MSYCSVYPLTLHLVIESKNEFGSAFGRSISISGDTAIVGASSADTDGEFSRSGAVVVFQLLDGVWGLQTTLVSDDIERFDAFGISVAISGNIAAVGADSETNVDPSTRSGATYMFERTEGTWRQTHKILVSDTSGFGRRVALEGDTLLVATPRVTNAKSNDGGAWWFERESGQWNQQAILLPSDDSSREDFGRELAVNGDTAMVVQDPFGSDPGGVFVFDVSFEADSDEDGFPDSTDNCPNTPNADQADTDENGTGDACEPIDDGGPLDSVVLAIIACLDSSNPASCGRSIANADGFKNRFSRAVLALGTALPSETVTTIVNVIDQWPSNLTNTEINQRRVALVQELGLTRHAARYWAVRLIAREIN